jgi:hypothetical protein
MAFRLCASFLELSTVETNLFQWTREDHMTGWRVILAALIGAITGSMITAGVFFYNTSVPTLIEQIQLVRRFLREVLKGSVLKQA